MKTIGYDKPLYVLPFDHRGSFETKMFGWHGDLTAAQTAEIAAAAGVSGFIGFAVGRTDFWQPLVDFRAKKITRAAAVAEIAGRYLKFVHIFEDARVEISAA